MTYVIFAGDTLQPTSILTAQSGLERQWLSINQSLIESGTALEELPLLTDDYAPLDRLLSNLLFSILGV